MLKIDIHTHILPKEIPNWKTKFGYGGFIKLEHHGSGCARMMKDDGHFFREVGENTWKPSIRLAEMDDTSVDVQVISTVPVMFSYWTKPSDGADIAAYLNDHIADIVTNEPRRFVGLGTVPLQDTQLAIRELERARSLGLPGVQIGSNVNQENLGESRFFEFFQACESMGMAVFVHPWEMMGESQMQKYWFPWLVGMPAETSRAICSLIFSGVLERLPNLRICFAHGGGSFPATIGRIEHGFDVRPDLCAIDNNISPRKYLDTIFFDSLVHDPRALRLLLEVAGKGNVALGSDYPFPLGEERPGELIDAIGLDDETRSSLFHAAALKWLNLDASAFAG
jgi:aminocarboxymuconate-semialdehyde decarboxylase